MTPSGRSTPGMRATWASVAVPSGRCRDPQSLLALERFPSVVAIGVLAQR